ncbi:MAG: 2OG-Fe(II) oxygenase [Xanthomonadales bacterium]|nr:2OG-Fe(II) oxygenase [Xanthomonadales bacterium]
MEVEIELNPDLNVDALAQAFATHGRLQIPELLKRECAEALLRAFQKNTQWYVAYNEGESAVESPLAEVQRLPEPQRQRFYHAINQRAGTQFQYCFLQYYITENVKRGENPEHPLHPAHAFLNSDAFLQLMREITGEPAIAHADALASVYGPGHFLTDHDDRHATRDRVAAYVLSLTKNWNRNWGGHLVFFDERGNISDGFLPSFNTLNMFKVPQSHAVQSVAPFARSGRSSITGWLHR